MIRSVLKKTVLVCLLFLPLYSEEFISSPKLLTDKQFLDVVKNKSIDMRFELGELNHFRFVAKDDVYFEIVFTDSLPSNFSKSEKSLFTKETVDEKIKYIYSFRLGENIREVNGEREPIHSYYDSYTVCERRFFSNSEPINITQEQLAKIIKDNNVVFYTGAGISAAAGIPTMDQLQNELGMENNDLFSFLKGILANPDKLVDSIKSFQIFSQACVWSLPTRAHLALAKLAQQNKIQVITENFDLLHERSRIVPYRIDPKNLKNEIEIKTLNKIDYLICIGLSYDDKGFLGWYKKHHPQGKIVAIDLHQPSYLGGDDFLLQGDIQHIIPKLAVQ